MAEKASILSEKEKALSNLRSSQGKSRSQFLRGRLSGSGDHSSTAAALGVSPTAAAGDSIAHASRQLGSLSSTSKRKGGSFFLKRDFNANGSNDDPSPPQSASPLAPAEALSPLSTAPPPNSVVDSDQAALLNCTPKATKLWGMDSDSDRERDLSPAPAPIRNPISPKDSIQEEMMSHRSHPLNSDRKSDPVSSVDVDEKQEEAPAKTDKRITKKIRRDSFGLVVKNPKAGMKRLSMTTQAGQAAFAAAATAAFQEAHSARKGSKKPEDDLDVEPDEVDEIYEKTIMKAMESVKKDGPGDAELDI